MKPRSSWNPPRTNPVTSNQVGMKLAEYIKNGDFTSATEFLESFEPDEDHRVNTVVFRPALDEAVRKGNYELTGNILDIGVHPNGESLILAPDANFLKYLLDQPGQFSSGSVKAAFLHHASSGGLLETLTLLENAAMEINRFSVSGGQKVKRKRQFIDDGMGVAAKKKSYDVLRALSSLGGKINFKINPIPWSVPLHHYFPNHSRQLAMELLRLKRQLGFHSRHTIVVKMPTDVWHLVMAFVISHRAPII